MKYFFRSLRYLKPYRVRVGVSIFCAALIAVLWSGGFALIPPGIKVLMTPEGLHGWAWNSIVEDRLGVTLVQRVVPADMRPIDGQKVLMVIDVVKVAKDSPAAAAGLKENRWIIGLDDGQSDHKVMRADTLVRDLAAMSAGQKAPLRIYDVYQDRSQSVPVTLGQEQASTRLLGEVAKAIPEPSGTFQQIQWGRYQMFLWLVIASLAVTLTRNFLRFFQEYLIQTSVFRACMDIRCENYGITLRLPMTYFSQRGSSDTMSRFIADTGEVAQGQETLLGITVVEPLKAVGCIIGAFMVSWKLTLLSMIIGPIVFGLIRILAKAMKRASRKALEGWSRMLGRLEETLTGVRVVKAYTMEPAEEARFKGINSAVYKQQRRMARIDSASSPMIEVLGFVAGLGAAVLAGYWVLVLQTMSADKLALWIALLGGMFDPMRKLSKIATRFHRADAGAQRIFELHDQQVEKEVPAARPLARHARSLAFDNITFRYPGAATLALENIKLEIAAGHAVAFVGPNGSGKTTLVSMVPRLLDPDSGRVLVDGQNVGDFQIRSLRQQIAVVTQDAVLFHATIAENIAYGRPGATREQIEAAAAKAFVDEFVRDMKDGYDTIVGEHGATLSGGQKQRIAIARAVLRDPAILIFDEAMSQVDGDSERRIHQAMQDVIRGRTTLIVAHRFATVLSADRIVVMDGGRMIDSGRHDELLGRCGLYRQLYETQFLDSSGHSR
ncbi:MAG: ATP-binding cassette domain-containing protein [Planctomycetaceae bacterium]|nr:ATP-binding cassette domain-containing protein [Planctomycetaceae bacterium]